MAGIEEAVCIQLAKFNDTEKSVSNARWSNHNKQPVTINQGDSISITKSFIDTRSLSSAGIVILEDTPLELEMFFYWINDGNPGSTSTGFTNTSIFYPAPAGSPPVPFPEYTVQLTLQTVLNINMETQNSAQQKPYSDGRPYLMVFADNSPFTQTWRYTLPKGTYTPDALATLLTTNMSEVKKQTAAALNKPNAVDWFDPFAPKVNLPTKTTLDQPFVVDTNSNSPLWSLAFLEEDGTINGGDFVIFEGVVNAQPYIQVEQNNGLPDWLSGTSGYYTIPPAGNPSYDPNIPRYPPGPPPKPSLTFKNIISDCPIPNVQTNLPNIPGGAVILASQMIVGLYYEIVTLGDTTDWLASGDTKVPPSVGDTFECISVPSVLPNPTIGFLQMALYKTYKVVTSGLPWTGPGGFDTNWALYSNNGAVNSTFATNAVQPIPIAITNSTDITLINVNITYTITASTNIDWDEFGASLPSNNPIAYTAMTVAGSPYEIVYLGLAYAPGGLTYDTAWAELGDLEPTPAVGNVFDNTKQYNIPIPNNNLLTNIIDGITFTITQTSDLINWGSLGYLQDPNINNTNPILPVIDPYLLIGYTYEIVSLGVYYGVVDGQSYYDTGWDGLTEATMPNPPGYTTPVVGDRFTTDGNALTPQTYINLGSVLNIVPNGQTLLVTNAGDINWALYGTVPTNNPIPYTHMNTGTEYEIVSLGLAYAPGGVTYDTGWAQLGDTNATLAVGDVFTNTQQYNIPIPNTNLLANIIDGIGFTISATTDNIFWGLYGWTSDPNLTQPNPDISITDPSVQTGETYIISNTGIKFGIYQDADIGPLTLYDTGWFGFVEVNNTNVNDIDGGDFVIMNFLPGTIFGQAIFTGKLLNMIPANQGVTLTVSQVGDIDWTLYGNLPVVPSGPVIPANQCVVGQKYIITDIGNQWFFPSPTPAPQPDPPVYSDSQWNILTGNNAFIATVGGTFTCAAAAPQPNTLQGGGEPDDTKFMEFGNFYKIDKLGTLTDAEWVSCGATSPATVGQIFMANSNFTTGNFPSGGKQIYTVLPYIQLNFTIQIFTVGNINWGAFGCPSPYSVGQTFVCSNIPNLSSIDESQNYGFNVINTGQVQLINPIPSTPFNITITSNPQNAGDDDKSFSATCVPTGKVSKTVSYQSLLPFTFTCNNTGVDNTTYTYTYAGEVIGSGTVKLNGFAVPFEIGITTNPGNASPTDNTFEALTYPTGTVRFIDSYQSLLPFTFKATATGVDNPNENYTYAGVVIGTGTVKSISPTFPFTFKCTEIPSPLPLNVTYSGTLSAPTGTVDFALGEGTVSEEINPNNPNFYIYPLKLVSDPVINTNYQSNGGDENPYVLTMYPTQMINYNFPLVGSTEIELAFNDQANIFQWNYTHSPILQASAPTASTIPVSFSEVVGIVNSFIPDTSPFNEPQTPTPKGYVSSTCKLVAKSGCMFRRMEPKSFWFDTLGFSEDLLVTDAELGLTNDGTLNPIALPADLNRFTYERFNSVTTRSLLSTAMNFTQSANYPNSEPSYINNMYYPLPVTAPVQSLNSSVIDSWYDYEMAYNFGATVISAFNIAVSNNATTISGTSPSGGNYASPPQWNQTWYQALDQTVTIPAVSTPALISDTYGHYLIEIEGYSSSLLNEQQKYGIKAIVSSYYNNIGSFTSLPFNDSAFLYQHVGESITLNNFRIRILDGKMEEVKGLGENSCVYLQINKAISQVEVQQV
jgi:hypothetical protein